MSLLFHFHMTILKLFYARLITHLYDSLLRQRILLHFLPFPVRGKCHIRPVFVGAHGLNNAEKSCPGIVCIWKACGVVYNRLLLVARSKIWQIIASLVSTFNSWYLNTRGYSKICVKSCLVILLSIFCWIYSIICECQCHVSLELFVENACGYLQAIGCKYWFIQKWNLIGLAVKPWWRSCFI